MRVGCTNIGLHGILVRGGLCVGGGGWGGLWGNFGRDWQSMIAIWGRFCGPRGLLMVPVGPMALCWPVIPLSGLWGRGAYGLCQKLRARRVGAPRLPKFILLVSLSDTLLVVSILDIVYDCHLRQLLQSWKGLINELYSFISIANILLVDWNITSRNRNQFEWVRYLNNWN